MDKLQLPNNSTPRVAHHEIIKIEKDLITLGFFSMPRYRGGKKNPKQEKIIKLLNLEEDGKEARTEILTHPKFGLPTTGDLTKYLAFLKIVHENHKNGNLINSPIKFTHYELLKKANIEPNKERYEQVTNWLERMFNTTIKFYGEIPSGADQTALTKLFDQISIAGTINAQGEKEKLNRVWLSKWAIKNICERPLIPIDMNTYQKLNNDLAKLLVVHLQVWLFASKKQSCFEKSYSRFCQLLDLVEQKFRGRIHRQLKAAFDELQKYDYVSKWAIEEGNKELKIKIWHGTKFQRDLKKGLFVLPEPEVTDENQFCEYLRSLGIYAHLVKQLIKKYPLEKLKLRTELALRKLKRTENISSNGGFLYSILNSNEEIEVEKAKISIVPIQPEFEDDESESLHKSQDVEQAEKDFREGIKTIPFTLEFYQSQYQNGLEIWKSILASLETKLHNQIIESWFKPLQFGGIINNRLVIIGNNLLESWISSYYTEDLNQELAKHNIESFNFIDSLNIQGIENNPEEAFRLVCINHWRSNFQL